MRYSLSPDVRRLQDGRVLLGGSPLRFLRLSVAGSTVVDRLASGAETGAPSEGARDLVDRLVDGGILVPEPSPDDGPFTTDDVTVVVPVRDRPALFRRALAAIGAGGAPARIIVVDDGSRDAEAIRNFSPTCITWLMMLAPVFSA